ncbi:MAG: hypothetical protein E3J81_07815 [Dehalococcoidia bacterium]|nr:MAG: hypothetical protein E3J81_07815 [Dehalococcoidia bacterium]
MKNQNGDLRVVIDLKDGKASVGIQAPECDPLFFAHQGNLAAVLGVVPDFVDVARKRWEKTKLNPDCKSPLPSQEKPPTPPKAPRSGGKPAPTGQTPMF